MRDRRSRNSEPAKPRHSQQRFVGTVRVQPTTAPAKLPVMDVLLTVGSTVTGIILFVVLLGMVFQQGEANEVPLKAPPDDLRKPLPQREIKLGEYSFINSVPSQRDSSGDLEDRVRMIEFDASAVVRGKMNEVMLMEDYLRDRKHRLREAIDIAVRSANDSSFDEPDCKPVRELIRGQINDMLGDDILQEVHFSHFRSFVTKKTFD
ncbi:hypothetical protein [Calycomorphotria hydatis]|uniref:Flagellar protein FliL n=1 Tax=Calycomorphotria hydatis TaxID=2528027 RepID=A0A517TCC8_9PLAN|nr:hypothetical protein [Calycomorphotria hydatis]QDT66027.1 hypothetical protein V22_32910 [Calycomorphotria hydatis]